MALGTKWGPVCHPCSREFMTSDDPPPTVDTPPSGRPLRSPARDASSDSEEADIRAESAADMPVPFDRVQAACQTFTAEWQAGGQTDLPSYLVKVAKDDQATLLRNLLEYEIHKRREHGESPRAEDYLDQLPKDTAIIRQVFLETSRLSLTGDQLPATEEFPRGQLPASRLGDFRLVRELGRGGMGSVFEAVHVQRGHRVALKTLPAVTPETLHRFKREFRLAAELVHPNLVSLHTLESDGGQYFITMDMVAGLDFRSWLRPGNILDDQRLRAALPQLIAAVMALHAQGVVHRDLKPHNVLVTPEGRVVVLDFGLVAELAGATATLGKIAGTPTYMAPEQAAGQSVGPPADWYAVGVMLYEALAGRLPFQSTDVWEVLRQKQERDAPPLPDDPPPPAKLGELCMKLLARTPADRPDPLEIAGVVQTRIAASVQPTGSTDELIGRETHLAALGEARDTMQRTGQPVTVFISGRSGEGKTSLAERFLAPVRQSSVVVLSGRCYDRESVPFKALDALIGALTDHLRSLPSDKAAQLSPDDIGMLARLFPELNRCEVIATAPSGRIDAIDQHQIRARAFGALRLLLERISQRAPIVIFIDDLQWGDEDSARALFEVLRPPDAPQVLFLGSYRSDEADDSPFLTEWRELQRVNDTDLDQREVGVGPLSLEQSTLLVLNQLDLDNDTVRRRAVQFHAQTGGNPFLLTELVGCFDPESNSFHATNIHGVLDQKLATLPAEAQPLLEAVSVSGQALDIDEAVAAADLASSYDDTLISMRNSRLLRMVGSKVDTYHDRIRHAILDKLASTTRQDLHARLANVIEERAGGLTAAEIDALLTGGELSDAEPLPRIYDLAYHWDAAKDTRKALAYGMAAAGQARGQCALEVAAEQYALAERNASNAPKAVRFRIARGRGEALMLMGHYDQAALELDRALPLAELQYDTADVIGLKGALARNAGMIADSIDHLEDAIGRLDVLVPRTALGLCWGIAKEVAVQAVHTVMPGRLHRRPPDRVADLCNWLLGQVEYCYYMNSVPKLLWASMVGLNRAERVPKSSSLALQYFVHANDMAVLGWHARAEKYYRASVDLGQQLNDRRLAALPVSHHSLGSLAAAKYETGIAKARIAKELLSKIEDAELQGAQLFLAMNLYYSGELAEATKEAQEGLHACVRHQVHYVSIVMLSLYVRSCLGQAPFEQLVGSVSLLPGNRVGQTSLFMAEGYWHAHHNRTGEALTAFEQAWDLCKKSQCLTTFNMSVVSDLASSLRRHSETLEAKRSNTGDVRRRWQRMAHLANRLSWFLPPERPHALRELSLAYAHRGRIKKALKLIAKSCRIAEHQNAAYEYAQSLLVMGQLGKQAGDASADDQIRTAQSKLDEIKGAVRDAMQSSEADDGTRSIATSPQ